MRFWQPRTVPGTPYVGVACAAYLDVPTSRRLVSLRGLVNSFEAQTYKNWKLEITHDGPLPDNGLREVVEDVFDESSRLTFVQTAERVQKFGHPHRQGAIERLLDRGCEWIGLTNDDNYYVPVYLEWMVSEAISQKAQFVYCDAVHSHRLWKPLPAEVRRGHIDLGSFLVHRDVARKIKFDKFEFAGDWDYISRVRSAAKKIAKVQATLFVHN